MYKKKYIFNSIKYKNYLFIDKTYEEYLKKVSIILNNIHNVNYSKEYWRIVIGPWLIFSISNIFYILKFNKSKNKNLSKKKYLKPSKTPNDYLDFSNKIFNESNWISCLKSEIFKVNLNSKKKIYSKKNIKENFINNFYQRLSFKQKIILNVQKLLSILSIKSDLIYWRSYFTTFNILKHSIQHGSLNIFDQYNFVIPKFKYQKQYRIWNITEKNRFEKVLNRILPKICPKTYLEGFKCMQLSQKKLFPNKISFIHTAVSYLADDYFKILAAGKKLKGAKLHIYQHGAYFQKYDHFQIHAAKVADKFLTWGKANGNMGKNSKKEVIGYQKNNLIFKDLKKKYFAFISINTVEKTISRYSAVMLTPDEYYKYLMNIKNFLNQIPKEIRKKIALAVKEEAYSINTAKKIFRKNFPEMDLYINSGKKLSKISKMHISTYLGTLELETINFKVPTIFFNADDQWELFNEYKKIFSTIKKNGYYFTNFYNAANATAKIYNNFEQFKLDYFKNYSIKKFKNFFLNK